MKTRIITGVIGAAALILLIIFADPRIVAAVIFLASLIGLFEFYSVTKLIKLKPLLLCGLLGAFIITAANFKLIPDEYVPAVFLLWIFLIFLVMLIFNQKIDIKAASLTVFSVLYIPNLFSYISMVLFMPLGKILIWFVLAGAFATDTFAYFTGTFLGKHKLCPHISPKKSIEGLIGGTIGCGILFPLMGYFFNEFLGAGLLILPLVPIGIITALFSQFGDLCASMIKRSFSVKDYGKILPGHGGIMDRCDSLIFVAPLIYFLFGIFY